MVFYVDLLLISYQLKSDYRFFLSSKKE